MDRASYGFPTEADLGIGARAGGGGVEAEVGHSFARVGDIKSEFHFDDEVDRNIYDLLIDIPEDQHHNSSARDKNASGATEAQAQALPLPQQQQQQFNCMLATDEVVGQLQEREQAGEPLYDYRSRHDSNVTMINPDADVLSPCSRGSVSTDTVSPMGSRAPSESGSTSGHSQPAAAPAAPRMSKRKSDDTFGAGALPSTPGKRAHLCHSKAFGAAQRAGGAAGESESPFSPTNNLSANMARVKLERWPDASLANTERGCVEESKLGSPRLQASGAGAADGAAAATVAPTPAPAPAPAPAAATTGEDSESGSKYISGKWDKREEVLLMNVVYCFAARELKDIAQVAYSCGIIRSSRSIDKKLKRVLGFDKWRKRNVKAMRGAVAEAIRRNEWQLHDPADRAALTNARSYLAVRGVPSFEPLWADQCDER